MPFEPRAPDESLYQAHRVYALIDHMEPENPERGELAEVYFDCVGAEWVDERVDQKLRLEASREAPASIIRLKTRAGNDPFSLDMAAEGDWLTLYLDNKKKWEGSLPIEHYASVNHLPLERFLDSKHDRPTPDNVSALNALTSLEPISYTNAWDIDAALANATPPEDVAVYDVGQGNCNGLRTNGRTLVYFDFGGGTLGNIKTYPNNIQFCLCRNPPVILSHWDWDHWASAERESLSLALKWIVPIQTIGMNHARLAATLHARGNLLGWPRNPPNRQMPFGLVQKCSGTSRNDSGLALLATGSARDSSRRSRILLPGDAQYSKIPDNGNGTLRGLVITHHGGRLRGSGVPAPGHDPKLVCSNGEHNSYGHPYHATIQSHLNAGWPKEIRTAPNGSTPRGHVGISFDQSPQSLACGGSICNTKTTK